MRCRTINEFCTEEGHDLACFNGITLAAVLNIDLGMLDKGRNRETD